MVVALLDYFSEGALCAEAEELELVGDDAEDGVTRVKYHIFAAFKLHRLELDALMLTGYVSATKVSEHGLKYHAVFKLVAIRVNIEDGRVDNSNECEHLHDEGCDVKEGLDTEAGNQELFLKCLLEGFKI